MDADVLTTISSLATTTKTTIEAVRAALAKSRASKETLALVTDLQTRVFELQKIAFDLQAENAQLREQVRQKEERTADRERYELRQFGQSPAVVDKQNPKVYLCATCFEAGEKTYLTPLPGLMGFGPGMYVCQKHPTPIKLT